jgi:gliding motility-associated-like protein
LWSDGRTAQNIVVTVAGTYTLTVRDAGNCQSEESNGIEVKTFTTPPKPVIEKLGSTTLCGTNTVGLLAPLGFSVYTWTPGGQRTAGITVAAAGSYAVRVGQADNCLSVASDPVVVITTGQPCTLTVDPVNQPPVIASARATTTIGGRIVLPLAGLISDPDNAINPASLRIAKLPASGAKAEIILARQELVVDYAGVDFAGQETVTVQICDVSASCSQQQIVIDITGAVKVYNVITPNGDGLNDGLYIEYIAILEEARNNTVRIFNRWGDLLYEAENYNNGTISFKGIATNGDPIPTGTYFYRIDFKSGLPPVTGYFSIRR